jgi:hypothetical protein
MKTIWFTSDLHLGHENVIRYAGRPFKDAAQMDEAIITNWRDRVKPGDDIYVVGDFSFHRTEKTKEILRSLPWMDVLREELPKMEREIGASVRPTGEAPAADGSLSIVESNVVPIRGKK